MGLLSRAAVVQAVTEAIMEWQVLQVRYQHTEDGHVVNHRIAPFDVGSSNWRTRERLRNRLFAYSFAPVEESTGRPDPKVCVFDVEHFLSMAPSGEVFGEDDLAARRLRAARYDYRNCRFAFPSLLFQTY